MEILNHASLDPKLLMFTVFGLGLLINVVKADYPDLSDWVFTDAKSAQEKSNVDRAVQVIEWAIKGENFEHEGKTYRIVFSGNERQKFDHIIEFHGGKIEGTDLENEYGWIKFLRSNSKYILWDGSTISFFEIVDESCVLEKENSSFLSSFLEEDHEVLKKESKGFFSCYLEDPDFDFTLVPQIVEKCLEWESYYDQSDIYEACMVHPKADDNYLKQLILEIQGLQSLEIYEKARIYEKYFESGKADHELMKEIIHEAEEWEDEETETKLSLYTSYLKNPDIDPSLMEKIVAEFNSFDCDDRITLEDVKGGFYKTYFAHPNAKLSSAKEMIEDVLRWDGDQGCVLDIYKCCLENMDVDVDLLSQIVADIPNRYECFSEVFQVQAYLACIASKNITADLMHQIIDSLDQWEENDYNYEKGNIYKACLTNPNTDVSIAEKVTTKVKSWDNGDDLLSEWQLK